VHVTELKILQANASNLFKVLTGQENKEKELKLTYGIRRKKGSWRLQKWHKLLWSAEKK
jgi:hypothetical protein